MDYSRGFPTYEVKMRGYVKSRISSTRESVKTLCIRYLVVNVPSNNILLGQLFFKKSWL